MRIISWNVNGLRSIYRKDFQRWAENSAADIICIQEIKAAEADAVALPVPKGYHLYINSAERKGYSGTACYVKERPLALATRIGHGRFDGEGRLLELEYPGFTLLNFYIPNGARDKRDIPYKLESYDRIFDHIAGRKKPLILAGDFNVAHRDIDLARPKESQRSTMFTPEERMKIDALLSLGFKDTFRALYPEAKERYTWWPYFANARERNLGWRIDYVFASEELAGGIHEAFILGSVQGSDHSPVGIDVRLS